MRKRTLAGTMDFAVAGSENFAERVRISAANSRIWRRNRSTEALASPDWTSSDRRAASRSRLFKWFRTSCVCWRTKVARRGHGTVGVDSILKIYGDAEENGCFRCAFEARF